MAHPFSVYIRISQPSKVMFKLAFAVVNITAFSLTLYNRCILLRLTSGFVNPRTVMFIEAKPR